MKKKIFILMLTMCGFAPCAKSQTVGDYNLLIVDGTLGSDAQSELTAMGHTVILESPANLTPGYDYTPYDAIIFMYNTYAPLGMSEILALNQNCQLGIILMRGENIISPADMGTSVTFSNDDLFIENNTHYITQPFSLGLLDLGFTYKSNLTTINSGNTILGSVSGGNGSLVIHDTYKRVMSPYYGHTDGMPWTPDAEILMDRIIAWAVSPCCTANTGIDVITSCNQITWIDGNVYATSNNTATHVLTNMAGCDSIVTLNLTIDDTENPVPNLVSLSNISSQCTVTSLTAPTATDNCAGTLTGTHNAFLPITMQGTTIVTWTYDDGNGNTITQSQNVIIDDNTPPVPDAVALADITSECPLIGLTTPAATDNCSGIINATHNITFPITTPGTTIVTWTYEDWNGNAITQNQNVIITPIDNGITQINFNTLAADASGYTYQWIDCDNGNTAIPGATDQQFTASTNGTYAVEISNGNCDVVSDCLNITELSTNENDNQNGIIIFPNPNNGNFEISIPAAQNQPTRIELSDMSGKLIETFILSGVTKIQMTSENLEDGIYLLRIITGNYNTMHKVVIQK